MSLASRGWAVIKLTMQYATFAFFSSLILACAVAISVHDRMHEVNYQHVYWVNLLYNSLMFTIIIFYVVDCGAILTKKTN